MLLYVEFYYKTRINNQFNLKHCNGVSFLTDGFNQTKFKIGGFYIAAYVSECCDDFEYTDFNCCTLRFGNSELPLIKILNRVVLFIYLKFQYRPT